MATECHRKMTLEYKALSDVQRSAQWLAAGGRRIETQVRSFPATKLSLKCIERHSCATA